MALANEKQKTEEEISSLEELGTFNQVLTGILKDSNNTWFMNNQSIIIENIDI